MSQIVDLTLSPKQAADQKGLYLYCKKSDWDYIGDVALVRVLKRSIDARQRRQVKYAIGGLCG